MSDKAPEAILLSHGPSAGVLHLTLNRPTRKNALTRDLVLQLGRALREASRDPQIKVIVLSGSGAAFCSGADLSTIVGAHADKIPGRIDEFQELIISIYDAPQPVIAQIDGPAVGFGADLALACDYRVMSSQAYFEEGFVKVGLMPDGGGTFWLQKYLGARAFEFLAFGTRLPAAVCKDAGIANRVVESSELTQEVEKTALAFTQAAPLALQAIKKSLRTVDRQSLIEALAREKTGQARLILSHDFQEGVSAFLEKRKARFAGS